MKVSKTKLTDLGVTQRGHFRLHSGLHTNEFWDLERLFWDDEFTRQMVREGVEAVTDWDFNVIVGIGHGGGMFAFALARPYGFHLLFATMVEIGGSLVTYSLNSLKGKRVLVVDDVVTTGQSLQTAVNYLQSNRVKVAGCLVILDRTKGGIGMTVRAIMRRDIPLYKAEECPLCLVGVPFTIK